MRGFFGTSELAQKPAPSLAPKCGLCGLFRACHSPKMPVYGKGKKGILLVSDYPGPVEDEAGKPLAGGTGRYVSDELNRLSIDMDRDCWRTNALICFPGKDKDGRVKAPPPKAVGWCRPNVVKTIKELKPHTIVLMGGKAIESVIGWLWKEDTGDGYRWWGWQVPSQRLNAWVCPTFNPAALFRKNNEEGGYESRLGGSDVGKRMFRNHLTAAVGHGSPPWEEVPDYRRSVQVCKDPNLAAETIRQMNARGGTVAFDFETDRLKPDPEDAEIVCCSVCWNGQATIAYPWHGAAIEATKWMLQNPAVAKVGSNIKFEHRWAKARLGITVRGWAWDTMLAAHVLDCRPGITGVKFQSFVRLGVEDWAAHVKPYLEGPTANGKNRAWEVADDKILEYCALDSLLEFKVMESQRKEMGCG